MCTPKPLSGLSRGTDAIDVFVSTRVGVAGSRLPIVGEGERPGCSRQEVPTHARVSTYQADDSDRLIEGFESVSNLGERGRASCKQQEGTVRERCV
jgi:hypothetical protein